MIHPVDIEEAILAVAWAKRKGSIKLLRTDVVRAMLGLAKDRVLPFRCGPYIRSNMVLKLMWELSNQDLHPSDSMYLSIVYQQINDLAGSNSLIANCPLRLSCDRILQLRKAL